MEVKWNLEKVGLKVILNLMYDFLVNYLNLPLIKKRGFHFPVHTQLRVI